MDNPIKKSTLRTVARWSRDQPEPRPPAEVAHLIVGIFLRGCQARVRGGGAEAGGAGLGLAIAQGLAQAQRGHIEVASTPGRGSTFTVVLPVAPA